MLRFEARQLDDDQAPRDAVALWLLKSGPRVSQIKEAYYHGKTSIIVMDVHGANFDPSWLTREENTGNKPLERVESFTGDDLLTERSVLSQADGIWRHIIK
jgi:hypothetical protein